MTPTLMSAVISHLWQSTIFLGAAGGLTLLLRRNSAEARYWVWFIASIKFLFPFALLTALGSRLGWTATTVHVARYNWLLDTVAQSSANLTAGTVAAAPSFTSALLIDIVLGIWAVGFSVTLISWWVLWRRLASTLRSAARVQDGPQRQLLTDLHHETRTKIPVELAFTESSLEPGVVGILRPVLLMPVDVIHDLDRDHMEAVLLHELAHVRRHDNLLALIHMLVQAVFWFHPMVWWLGTKLVEERERACDEDVVCFGKKPHVYAESILTICRYCLSSTMPCVSGIAGGDLRKRIETIISRRVGQRLSLRRKILLAGTIFAVIAVPVLIGMSDASAVNAQTQSSAASKPKFNVATIKPSDPRTNLSVQFAPGGRLVITHATVRFLMKIAYDVGDDQITGGPSWVHSQRFDVEAKPDVPLGGDPHNMTADERRVFQEQVRLRLQSLLADRFQLRLTIQSKELPVYALTLGKNGPKMQPSTSADGLPAMKGGRGEIIGTNASMTVLAGFLGEQSNRPVVDGTGLKGKYNFQLTWTPDSGQTLGVPDASSNTPASVSDTGTSLFTAVQEQLGLKLESRKSPADLLTVQSATIPVEN